MKNKKTYSDWIPGQARNDKNHLWIAAVLRRETPPAGRVGRNDKAGFTLIELLVAMGIVAVLTGMAVFNFSQSRIRARDIQRKSDLSQLQKAMELYKNDNNGNYPEAGDFQSALMAAGYSKVEFNDPRDGEWSDYYYSPDDDRKTYYLMTCLENTTDQTKQTDTTICGKFKNPASCSCGATITDSSGVMYTLSQP